MFALGTWLTFVNVYLTFLRFPIYLARGGTKDKYKWVSGIPLFGSLFLWGCIPLVDFPWLKWTAAFISLFDTGGLHWGIYWTLVMDFKGPDPPK